MPDLSWWKERHRAWRLGVNKGRTLSGFHQWLWEECVDDNQPQPPQEFDDYLKHLKEPKA